MFPIYTCPSSAQRLSPVDDNHLADLNEQIRNGTLTQVNGLAVFETLSAALVRDDGYIVFPVIAGIPLLRFERAIDLSGGKVYEELTKTGRAKTQDSRKLASEFDFWLACRKGWEDFRGPHFEKVFLDYFKFTRSDFKGKRVLDIGCGPLGTLEWLENSTERIGMDPLAIAYRQFGTREHQMQYVEADCEAIPFPDGYFDVVCSFNSLDHVEHLEAVIKEITRVTKPGGLFLLITDIHAQPTINEPQAFSWNIAEAFGEFECVSSERLEKHLTGVYDSLFERKPYNFSDAMYRYGIFTAAYKRCGKPKGRDREPCTYDHVTLNKLPWSDEGKQALFDHLPHYVRTILRELMKQSAKSGGASMPSDDYGTIVYTVMTQFFPWIKRHGVGAIDTYTADFHLRYGFLVPVAAEFANDRGKKFFAQIPDQLDAESALNDLLDSMGLGITGSEMQGNEPEGINRLSS